jgi:hypothetical protein
MNLRTVERIPLDAPAPLDADSDEKLFVSAELRVGNRDPEADSR